MGVRKSSSPVSYDDRTDNEKLTDLFEKLVLVCQSRGGDVDTEDGTFATVDLNELLHLEHEFTSVFGVEVEEIYNISRVRWLVKNKVTKDSIF